MAATEQALLNEGILKSVLADGWPEADVSRAIEYATKGNGRIPPTSPRLPSDLVATLQRERLLAAMLKAAAEVGYRPLTVQHVLDKAGVSRPTFYEYFENKEDCFLAAFDAAATRLRDRVRQAAAESEDWYEQLRAGTEELVRFTDDEPDAASILVVEARCASTEAILRREELLEHFTDCLRGKGSDSEPPRPALAAAGIVGGIDAVLFARLSEGGSEELETLLPSLMRFAAVPA